MTLCVLLFLLKDCIHTNNKTGMGFSSQQLKHWVIMKGCGRFSDRRCSNIVLIFAFCSVKPGPLYGQVPIQSFLSTHVNVYVRACERQRTCSVRQNIYFLKDYAQKNLSSELLSHISHLPNLTDYKHTCLCKDELTLGAFVQRPCGL